MKDCWMNIWMNIKDGGWLDEYMDENEGWWMVG